MDKNRRTRQSNREYQERVRKEVRQRKNTSNDDYISVVPRSGHTTGRQPMGGNSQNAMDARTKRSTANRGTASRSANPGSVRPKKSNANQRESQAENRRTRPKKAAKQVYFDYTLLFIVVFLAMFGLLMLYTASIYTNEFFVKQCLIGLVGVIAMVIVSFIDYHVYAIKPITIAIVVCSVALVFMVWSPLGVNLNGATRWIGVGPITLQPAEVFKICVILMNAVLITKFSSIIAKWQIMALFAALTLSEILLILVVTENLSSALIIGLITVLMYFVAHPGYKIFVAAAAVVGTLGTAFVFYVLNSSGSGNFRFGRIIAWLAPERLADQSKVYQTNQALYAIGSGGLWGKGLGSGTQKMIVPEAMNDMIFAIICEEMGMIGAFLVLVMFAVLLYRLMFIAKNSKDLLGGMIATGIFAHFMIQVVLNIGVVTNLLPSTGVTLPFISYGGTALVLLMVEVGIALNISRQIDFEQPKLVRRKKRRPAADRTK